MGVVDNLIIERDKLKRDLEKSKARGDRYFEQAFEDRQKLLELQRHVFLQRARLRKLDELHNTRLEDLGLYKFTEKWFETKKWYLNRIDSSREILDLFWKLYELVQYVDSFQVSSKNGKRFWVCSFEPGDESNWIVFREEDRDITPITGSMSLDEAIDFAKALAEQN